MVTKITTPDSLDAVLNYNEKKVQQGKATCIHAGGFLRNHTELSFAQKKEGFERLNRRNERSATKTLHVSINFDPSEKLKTEKMVAIAEAYLKGIGFEGQPFLVYQHKDAGHPHIHIVTTTIREDGSRINTHNLGRNKSEKTRKQLEQDFGLVKAAGKQTKQLREGVTIVPMQYGQTATKEYLQQVISQVLEHYLVSSIPELNAVLRKYNVQADRGEKTSRMYQMQGLQYGMLDKNGIPVGVPIKASALKGKPGLKRMEQIFEKNKAAKEAFKKPLKNAIESVLQNRPADLKTLAEQLRKQNIEVILRTSADGRVYGITFIDERNKTVINGSDLGKAYSAAHLEARIKAIPKTTKPFIKHNASTEYSGEESMMNLLLKTEQDFVLGEGQFKKRKRRKKRKNLGLN